MDADDLELFERSLRNATAQHTGGALDAELAQLGWHEALAVDAHAAISTLFELQGRANTTSSALDHVYLYALGVELTADTGAVWPAFGGCSPPARIDRTAAVVDGLGSGALRERSRAVVVGEVGAKTVALIAGTSDLTLGSRTGIDPALSLLEVTGDRIAVQGELEPVRWDEAVALCQLAIAHELQGTARTMLDLAREHALERVQFGQTISSFQAVRHRLAETLVALEMADSMLDTAWADRSSTNAAMAKALAGRGARVAARHCQQVLAGIGFTTEHPFHLFLRRVMVLDQLFGSSRTLTDELGRELLRTRRLPVPRPL